MSRNLIKHLIQQSYDTGHDYIYDNIDKLLDLNLSEAQYIKICLHLCQRTYTGFYSITFNKNMRNNYINIGEYFPELSVLNPEQKDKVKLIYDKELEALNLAFNMAKMQDDIPKFFRNLEDSNIPDCDLDDLYSLAYNQVSINNDFKLNNDFKSLNQVTFSSPITYQIILEDNTLHCIPIKELLMSNQRIRRCFPIEVKLIEYGIHNT